MRQLTSIARVFVMCCLLVCLAVAQTVSPGGTSKLSYTSSTSGTPTTAGNWRVLNGTTVIASNAAANGWSVTLDLAKTELAVTAPATAATGTGFSVQFEQASNIVFTSTFQLPNPSGLRGAVISGTFWATPLDPPASGATWDVVKAGTVVASNTTPNGWIVTTSLPTGATVKPPVTAALALGYQFRYLQSGGASFFFDVVTSGGGTIPDLDVPIPSWAEDVQPADSVQSGGNGPSSADSINPANGVHSHTPPVDIIGNNPVGPDATFRRYYRSSRALAGAKAPGLSAGWWHNYSYTASPVAPGTWGGITIRHPNGGSETFTPVLSAGTPTGAFTSPNGTPYTLKGVAGSTTGRWNSLTLVLKDLTQWVFSPDAANPDSYRLKQLVNVAGRFNTINYDAANSYRISSVVNDAGTTLLAFAYDGSGLLQTVTDRLNRQVQYTFTTLAGRSCLATSSQIVAAGTSGAAVRWQYSYSLLGAQPFLSTVGVPNPATGSGIITHPINFDSNTAKATSLVDANGNQHIYQYNTGGTANTLVTVKNNLNVTVLSWTQLVAGTALNGGVVDASGHASGYAYTDPNNPTKPTSFTNRNGKTVSWTYDLHGNILTSTDLRGVVTQYTYDYSVNPNGNLTSVQRGTLTPTYIDYNAAGRLYRLRTPMPGMVSTTQVISKEYAYTANGNVQSVKVLNSLGAQVAYTFNYTTDGAFTQPETPGQPLTITDPLGRVTHYRYDSNGNLASVTDAVGNTTSYAFDETNRPTSITLPKLVASNPTNAVTQISYLGTKDVADLKSYDEAGALVRQVNNGHGNEGEQKAVTGGVLSSTLGLDALYRPVSNTNGASNTSSLGYDANGNATSFTHPLGDGPAVLAFDNDGNATQVRNGNGAIINLIRATDDARVTDIQYPAAPAENVHFVHDSYGRVTQVTDQTGSTSYTYDDIDNILTVTYNYTSVPAQTVSYTYSADGSRASMTMPKGTFNYAYDSAGQMITVQCPWNAGTSFDYTYKANGLLDSQKTSKTFTKINYNARRLPSSLQNRNRASTAIYSNFISLKYDGVGNLTGYSGSIGAVGSAKDASSTVTIGYDSYNKIASERRIFTVTTTDPGYNYPFVRSAAGNLTTSRSQTYSFNANDQQTGTGVVYNNSGQKTQDASGSYTYDTDGNPTGIYTPSSAVVLTAAWRGDGLRGWKQDGAGKRVYYIYDGDLPIAEILPDGSVYAAYAFGPFGLVQRWDKAENAYTAFTWDPLGNLVQRHKQAGEPVLGDVPHDTAVYDSYGQMYSDVLQSGGGAMPPIDPIGAFAQWGSLTDEQTKGSATGFALKSNKYYDPSQGRYLSREERFPNGYVDEDDGAATIAFFHAASMVPVAGAPFALAIGVDDLQNGNYLSGGLNIVGAVLPFTGDAIAAARGLKAAGEFESVIKVGSGTGGNSAPMEVVRLIKKGEKVADLIDEAKAGQWEQGVEHAIVSFKDGTRAIVKGGPEGIEFAQSNNLRRLIFHTHPSGNLARIPGPSKEDIDALHQFRSLWGMKQRTSWVSEKGQLYKYGVRE